MAVESVKEKLWKKCGTSVDSMCLALYDDSNTKISDLNDNLRPLGFYSLQDGYRLHVIDLDPSSITSGGWLEDTSLVEKYSISEEVYGKLDALSISSRNFLSIVDFRKYYVSASDIRKLGSIFFFFFALKFVMF